MWSKAAHSNENWMCTLLVKPRNPVPCWLHQNYQWDRDTRLQVLLLSEIFSVNSVLLELENVNSYYKCSILWNFLKGHLSLASPAPEFKLHSEYFKPTSLKLISKWYKRKINIAIHGLPDFLLSDIVKSLLCVFCIPDMNDIYHMLNIYYHINDIYISFISYVIIQITDFSNWGCVGGVKGRKKYLQTNLKSCLWKKKRKAVF